MLVAVTLVRSGWSRASSRLDCLRLASLGLALLVSAGAPVGQAQNLIAATAPKESAADYRSADGLTGEDIIARMIESNRQRDERLENYSSLRTYEIRNADGRVSAQAVIRVDYRAPGSKTFRKISAQGSPLVRHMVFDRLLESEEELSSREESRDSAISSENYSFKFIGQADLGDSHCYIIELRPKRIEKYLFEGTLWVDSRDFAIVQISGHPAKRLSFWIRQAEFVRQYRRIGGFWLPYRDETVVDVKANGMELFRIEHGQYVVNGLSDLLAESDALH